MDPYDQKITKNYSSLIMKVVFRLRMGTWYAWNKMALHLGSGFDVSHNVLKHAAVFQRGLSSSTIIEINTHHKHPSILLDI